jgi:hypothetical protein
MEQSGGLVKREAQRRCMILTGGFELVLLEAGGRQTVPSLVEEAGLPLNWDPGVILKGSVFGWVPFKTDDPGLAGSKNNLGSFAGSWA